MYATHRCASGALLSASYNLFVLYIMFTAGASKLHDTIAIEIDSNDV